MGVRDPSRPSVASVSRCQPVTFKCPHATETNVAPSRAATRLLALPPTVAQVDGGPGLPAAPVRAPRVEGPIIRCAGRCPLTHKLF